MLSLIVAASENNVIGKNNQLPWHLPNDLRFFKNTTWAMPVIMGRKNFEAMKRPLPGRMNIVITSNNSFEAEGVFRAHSLDHSIELAETANCREIFIIGGGEIFRQALPMADKIYFTRVHTEIEGDVFFPEFDWENEWELQHAEFNKANEKNVFDHTFEVYTKKHIKNDE